MNTLSLVLNWGTPSFAATVLERLLAASLEAGVLALGVAVLIAVARPRSPRVRSLLWLIVLLKPMVSLTLGSALPILLLEAPPALAPQALAAPAASIPEAYTNQGLTTAQALVGLWATGVLLAGGAYAWARLRLHRIVGAARPVDPELTRRYQAIAAQLGLKRVPRLAVSPALESPAIVGLAAPMVLLPAWLAAERDPRRLDWSLRHELTHWRWLDPLLVVVRDAALILFWFHPAVWWSGRRLLETMELACDLAMLRRPAEATEYAEQLFGILESVREHRRRIVAGGLFATRTQIGKRIAALLENSPALHRGLTWRSTAAVVAIAGLAFVAGVGFGGSGHDASLGADAIAAPSPAPAPTPAREQPARRTLDFAKPGTGEQPGGFGGLPSPEPRARTAKRTLDFAAPGRGEQPGGFGSTAATTPRRTTAEAKQPATPRAMGFGGVASPEPREAATSDAPKAAPPSMGFGGTTAPRGMGGVRTSSNNRSRRTAAPASGMGGFGGVATRPQ